MDNKKNLVTLPKSLELLALVVLSILGLIGFFLSFDHLITLIFSFPDVTHKMVVEVIDIILLIFIIIELMKISISYLEQTSNILNSVLEATIIAILREIIVASFEKISLSHSISIAILLTVVFCSYYFIKRIE